MRRRRPGPNRRPRRPPRRRRRRGSHGPRPVQATPATPATVIPATRPHRVAARPAPRHRADRHGPTPTPEQRTDSTGIMSDPPCVSPANSALSPRFSLTFLFQGPAASVAGPFPSPADVQTDAPRTVVPWCACTGRAPISHVIGARPRGTSGRARPTADRGTRVPHVPPRRHRRGDPQDRNP